MFKRDSVNSPLLQQIIPVSGFWADLALVLTFSLLTAICAQVAIPIPFTPVPITGQTFAVLLSGFLLGGRKGALSQALYLAEGLVLPVFSPVGAFGVARILGPTGGYLLSYPLAAFVVGFFAERGWSRNYWKTAITLMLGEIVIYIVGVPWLARFLRRGLLETLPLGLFPFLIGDAIKIIAIVFTIPLGWSLVNRRQDAE